MGNSKTSAEDNPILVTLDLSERSTACLSHGCEMAAKFRQPLILAHVVHETTETMGMYRRHRNASDTMPINDIARTMLEERVAEFREAHPELDQGCEIRLVVVGGIPETRIPELALRHNASMILMCSHNRNGLSHWIYGSVTETVVRRAHCPVVVVGQEETPFSSLTVHRPAVREATALGI